MKLKMKFLLLTLMIFGTTYSQCNTYKIPLNDEVSAIAMTEKIYQNDDLENGAKTFYVSVTSIPLGDDKSANSLTVTYISTNSSYWIIPNTLKITLPSGEVLNLKAKSKSYQTLNSSKRVPETSKSVECSFYLDYDAVLKIMGEQEVSEFIISDYTSNKTFNATPIYKGVLNEILKCVLNIKF